MKINTFHEIATKSKSKNVPWYPLADAQVPAYPLADVQVPASVNTKTDELPLNCPHNRFIEKHLCVNCTTVEDALAYSEARVKFAPTGTNGVLFGTSDKQAWDSVPIPNENYHLCQNKHGMNHYTCNMKTKKCRLDGSNCYSWHHTRNGHLFYKETICSDTGYNLNNVLAKNGEVNDAMSSTFGENWKIMFKKETT